MDGPEADREAVGVAAAALVQPGMRVGLGTGSTASAFVRALAARRLDGLRCVATSPSTEELALGVGLQVEPFNRLDRLDLAVDGADEVAPDRWVIKGGGGAHTRERVVAAAAERFVCIVAGEKLVDRLARPVPLELSPFGLAATLRHLGTARLRDAPRSADGGVIADLADPLDDPAALARRLDATPGVIDHGLFSPELITEVIVVSRGAVAHLGG